jgi:TolA-binding protein
MKPVPLFKILLPCLVGTMLLVGCATTGFYGDETQTEPADSSQGSNEIDQLLGSDGSNDGENINEDDVLRILGVGDENKDEASLARSEESAGETSPVTEYTPAQAPSTQAASAKTEKAVPVWKANSFSDRYQEALQTYRAHRLQDAIQKFETLLTADSKNSLADNCQYWIGEAYYDMANFNQAILAFEKVFTYANSNKDDHAQLKIGLCYEKMNDRAKAKAEFQKLVNDYPTSEYIGFAKRKVSELEGTSPSQ